VLGLITTVADENIVYVREAFRHLGRVRVMPGRTMTAASVKDADVLLVRSVTKVNEELLGGSNVKMVATATIGTDHVDQDYLSRSGIAFANAAGSNANSVAEYVIAALLTLAEREPFRLDEKTVGIVGAGNVGSKVSAKCAGLGINVLKNDPPLKELTGSGEYIELDELLASSDIVTLHVPLTVSGRWPTYHMVDQQFLDRLRDGCLLVNTSRGAVVDSSALDRSLESGKIKAVLDVWENEPDIDPELMPKVALGTAHIAGYSFDGKVNATAMVYNAVCKFLGVEPQWQARTMMPAPAVPLIKIDPTDADEQELLRTVVKRVYDIEADDQRLREILSLPASERGRYFDQLRKHYPRRREFFNTMIEFSSPPAPALEKKLTSLGFKVTGS